MAKEKTSFMRPICEYEELDSRNEIAFLRGKMIPIKDAHINIMTQAFLFGTAIYEGIRGYYNKKKDQVYIFRLYDHYRRMHNNLNILKMKDEDDVKKNCEITLDLIRANSFKSDCYIRAISYKSSLQIGLSLLDKQDLAIFALSQEKFSESTFLSVCISSWRRVQDNAIPPSAKINGAYVNSCLAVTEAKNNGFDDAIFLNEDGTVSEATGMNLFIVYGNKIITTPKTANILDGITKDTLITIAKEELNLDVEIRIISRSELYKADEVFLCGTAAEILSVNKIDHRTIGIGINYNITQMLQEKYDRIVRGEDPKYNHWLFPVY